MHIRRTYSLANPQFGMKWLVWKLCAMFVEAFLTVLETL